jgi:hypothetical protein
MRSEPPTGDELTRLLVSMKQNVLEQAALQPAPKQRSTMADRVIALAIGIAVLLGLGAGAAFAFGVVPLFADDPVAAPAATPSATPTPTPPATPTPTPVPSPERVAEAGQPPSRLALDCETMIDPAVVSALFSTEVGPADPIITASGYGAGIPRYTSLMSEGGVVCVWTNGAPFNDEDGIDPENVEVTVTVLPQPDEGWSERAVRYGMPAEGSACNDRACSASTTILDAWVAIDAVAGQSRSADPAVWQSLVDEVITAVSAAGPAAPGIEDASAMLPLECDALLPLDAVRTVTGSPEAIAYKIRGEGGWSAWSEARIHRNDTVCRWAPPQSDETVAIVELVRGGRWAFDRMLQAGTATPIVLAGLHPDDEAVLRCEPSFGPSCGVDLRLGQDWFNVVGNDEATAIALAEALVAQQTP